MCKLQSFIIGSRPKLSQVRGMTYGAPGASWIDALEDLKSLIGSSQRLAGRALATRGQADLAAVVSEWLLAPLRWLDWDSAEEVTRVAIHWTGLLSEALSQKRLDAFQEQKKGILAGFNLVRDVTVDVTRENLDVVQRKLNNQGLCLWRKVCAVFNDPESHGKHTVDPTKLAEIIQELQACDGVTYRVTMGGAPANMAFVLSHLGERVYLACSYFSNQLPVDDFPQDRVFILKHDSGDQCRAEDITGGNAASEEHPCVSTLAVAAPAGLEFEDTDGKRKQVPQPARALFTGRAPVSGGQRQWNQVKMSSVGCRCWPFTWWPKVLLCASVKVKDGVLDIAPVARNTLTEWAGKNCRLALIRDPGKLDGSDFSSPEWADHLTNEKNEQILALLEAGLALHFELHAGCDVGLFGKLAAARDARNDRSKTSISGGLNPDELVGVYEQALTRFGRDRRQMPTYQLERGPAGLLNRFLLAARIRELLGLDWLYVHGNEIDLAVFAASDDDSGGSNELGIRPRGIRLRDAMLFAKAAVVGALICRLPEDQGQEKRRSALADPGPCAKGLLAVVAFAREFAKWRSQLQTENRLCRDTVLNALLKKGVWVDSELKLGIAVAPVVWPDVAREFPTTGAGDFSSAVVAAWVSHEGEG